MEKGNHINASKELSDNIRFQRLRVFTSDFLCFGGEIQSAAADNIMAFSSKDCPQLQKKKSLCLQNKFLFEYI
jgi:hypothetical protein